MNNPLNDLVKIAASSQANENKLELLSLKLDLLINEAALRDAMVLLLLFRLGISPEKINEAYFDLRSEIKKDFKHILDVSLEKTKETYKVD